MLVALLLVLLAAAIVAGTLFWLGRQMRRSTGAPELIRAEPGPYKVKPDDPGGLDVAGDSETAYSTSAGEDPDAALDMNKLPQGVDAAAARAGAGRRRRPRKSRPTRPRSRRPATPRRAAPAGPTIQLGAYASTIKADTAWSMLSARFPEVAALQQVGGQRDRRRQVVYRLRAVGIVRPDQRGLRRAEGGGRKLPGGQLMQAAIYGLAGLELTADESALSSAMRGRPATSCSAAISRSRAQLRALTDCAARPRRP